MEYTKPVHEVADVIKTHRYELEKEGKLNHHKKRVFTNLSQCRTEKLGYHIDQCDHDQCGYVHISYNSCRDRHCPKCNGLKREKWVRQREEDLLPVKYYHVVFTLPIQLNQLCLTQVVIMYNLLFQSAWQTINKFALDHKHLGAQTGMVCILHTWGQTLSLHPHIHCIVPGGGMDKQGKWRNTKSQGKYLFPVKALSKVFRGIFTDGLIKLDKKGVINLEPKFIVDKKYLHPLYKTKWVVFAKLPMHNTKQAINYLGRYTHRIAISNHRIKSIDNDMVKFSWLDYRDSKTKEMPLPVIEFLKRFSLHILPPGFVKIRHYGILSSRKKTRAINGARGYFNVKPPVSIKKLNWRELFVLIYKHDPMICPKCKIGTMRVIQSSLPQIRGSPNLKLPVNTGFYTS